MSISRETKEILRPLLLALVLVVCVSFFSFRNKKTANFSLGLSDTDYSHNAFVVSTEKLGIKTPELLLVDKNSFRSTYPPFTITAKVLGALMSGFDADPDQEIREYVVEPGDSLSSIAVKFDISIDTIAWANNVKSQNIRSGDKLIILPVSGVMHLVKSGDTVQIIAETYRAEENDIVAFNDLSRRAEIFEGEVLVIPGGRGPSSSFFNYSSELSKWSTNDYYGQSHSYPRGQCTWFVAQMRTIPSWGNANTWISNARVAGYSVCSGRFCSPQIGAVIYLKGHRVYGHVGYVVEGTKGSSVVFSEMNYLGLGVQNLRSLPVRSSLIQGYIY